MSDSNKTFINKQKDYLFIRKYKEIIRHLKRSKFSCKNGVLKCMYRNFIKNIPQISELYKIKNKELPKIPDNFNIYEHLNKKTERIIKDIDEWIKELRMYESVVDNIKVSRYGKKVVHNEKLKLDIKLLVDSAIIVQRRCVHNLIYPNDYDYRKKNVLNYMHLYWKLATEFSPEKYKIKDCEYFSVTSQNTSRNYIYLQSAKLVSNDLKGSYEFFSVLSQFINMYNFVYEDDKKILQLFVEGFSLDVIAGTLGLSKKGVKEKLVYYINILKENLDKFYEYNVKNDEEDDLQEINEIRALIEEEQQKGRVYQIERKTFASISDGI